MRVICGSSRGVKLIPPDNYDIRPTLDRVKQAVFNVIQFKIPDASVLDVFAGSGALGIEALSRGCRECVFNDISPVSCALIRENCKKAGFTPALYCCDFKTLFEKIKGRKFDIIFIDPPYESGFGIKAINLVLDNGFLERGGVIVFEHSFEISFEYGMPGVTVKNKKYGIASVDFIYNN